VIGVLMGGTFMEKEERGDSISTPSGTCQSKGGVWLKDPPEEQIKSAASQVTLVALGLGSVKGRTFCSTTH
jgi:hypothetical protein